MLDNTAPYVGDTITVDPKFSDVDADTEDTTATGTSYQWQVEDTVGSGTFSDIPGATGKTYVPVDADKGKKLVVKVTPRTDPAITEPAVGDEVLSDVALIQVAQPVPDAANSTLSVVTIQTNKTITAGEQSDTDLQTKATLTLAINDSAHHPVKGQTVSFNVTPADAGVAVSNVVDNQDGTYTAVLTATKAQQYAITAQVNGAAFGNTLPNLQDTVLTIGAAPDAAHTVVESYNNLAQAAIASDTPNVGFQAHLFDRFNNIATWKSTDLNITVPGFDAGHVTTSMDASTNTITVSAGAKNEDDVNEYIGEQVGLVNAGGPNLLAGAPLSKLTIVPKIKEVELASKTTVPLVNNAGKTLTLPILSYSKADWIPVNPATKQDFASTAVRVITEWGNNNKTETSSEVSYVGAPTGFSQTVKIPVTQYFYAVPYAGQNVQYAVDFYTSYCSLGVYNDLSTSSCNSKISGEPWQTLLSVLINDAASCATGSQTVVTYAVDRGPYKHDPYDQSRPISAFMNGGRGYASANAPWNALISALDVGRGAFGAGWIFGIKPSIEPYQ